MILVSLMWELVYQRWNFTEHVILKNQSLVNQLPQKLLHNKSFRESNPRKLMNRIDQYLDVIGIHVWRHAVAEIEDMAGAGAITF